MKLVLTDFMQMVSLKDPKNAKCFLVFTNEKGEELRVPVGPEAIEVITRFAFKQEAPEETPYASLPEEPAPEPPGGTLPGGPEEDEDFEGAEVYGGDEDEDEDPVRPFELPPATEPPKSEEEIASL